MTLPVIEYEWSLYEMQGRTPSDNDQWNAGGTHPTEDGAFKEATHYLQQYANDDTGFRYEVYEVKRKCIGYLVHLPEA